MRKMPVLTMEFGHATVKIMCCRLNVLRKLIKDKNVLDIINACDAGREGELIFRYIVQYAGTKKPIKRLWLQSMTSESIHEGFSRLRNDAEMQPLANAARSRNEADWLVGINATRAFTLRLSGGRGSTVTSLGRVQTPTLAIIVDRENKIKEFKPRAVPRLWHREFADAIQRKCTGKEGVIELEEKKPSTQIAPQLYDLTSLQREANSRFGFSAKRTLQIAQALYERHKAITYPRTDSRALPEDYMPTVKATLSKLENPFARRILDNHWVKPNKRIFNDAKIGDHFAIIPTDTVPRSLDNNEQAMFETVIKRFVAVFFPPAQYENTTRITRVEDEQIGRAHV